MREFQYGQTRFEWRYQRDENLKRHYVTVERGRPVLLRGPLVGQGEQEALIRHRARWIREKLAVVNLPLAQEAVVTGSRLRYAGRSYFTEVRRRASLTEPRLRFTAARFVIENPGGTKIEHEAVVPLLEKFLAERAEEKLPARVRHWERLTGLKCSGVRVKLFQSRWASCDARNVLEFHPMVMELPAGVLDYVIVHELCHTVEKSHTKGFWARVAHCMPKWRQLHEVLEQAAFGDAV
jgi:predicted metal-dependent hydrolase